MTSRRARGRAALVAECLGTAALTTAVVGSGIMADRLAGENAATALLANAFATGAALAVLIAVLGPISGAHFNPAVSLAAAVWCDLTWTTAIVRAVLQVGAVAGIAVAHVMFALPLLQLGTGMRTGPALWFSEVVATCGLLVVVRLGAPSQAPALVSLYIVSAYWFTASTSFANPAVTIARSLTATFTGIRPTDVWPFIASQAAGTAAAILLVRWLRDEETDS